MTTARAVRFGDNVDTDQIIPAVHLLTGDPVELGKHAMEGADPAVRAEMRPGDIIVAGTNFGCGSSREHAPLALKGAGAPGVIAASFARIFYRNAINIGLPIFECPEAAAEIVTGDEVTVDVEGGGIKISRLGDRVFRFEAFPPELRAIIAAGGLMEYVKGRAAGEAQETAGCPV